MIHVVLKEIKKPELKPVLHKASWLLMHHNTHRVGESAYLIISLLHADWFLAGVLILLLTHEILGIFED